MTPSRPGSPRLARCAALAFALALASGCAAISGLDALDVTNAADLKDATVDLPEGSVVLPDGAVVLPDGAVVEPDGAPVPDATSGSDGAVKDAPTIPDAPLDSPRPRDGAADARPDAGPDAARFDAGVDAGDTTFACGTDRCSSNDVCCVGANPSCGGLPCGAGQTWVGCIDVATCIPRGGGVCCLTAGSHTGCASSCAGATVCAVDSDCPGASKCRGSDSTLGKTVGICQ
jgi:hypothetical protein